MYFKEEQWKKKKPLCNGCKYQGTDLPCEYILITGKSPQSQGAHIDPNGKGGCELHTGGKRKRRIYKIVLNADKKTKSEEKKPRKVQPSKLDRPDVVEMYRSGANDREIAYQFGVSTDTVTKWRHRNGLPPHNRVGFKRKMDTELAMELYRKGWSDVQIAKAVGVDSSTSVRYWRIKNNLPRNFEPGGRET